MHKETISLNSCTWRILFGFNFPFVIWFAAAVLQGCGFSLFAHCPMRGLFGFCPGCGLTHDFAALLTGNPVQGVFVYFILALFAANFFHSLYVAHRKRYQVPVAQNVA